MYRRMRQSLIGKTHRHYLQGQRRNHQWSMVINNIGSDDDVIKPGNPRRHRQGSGSVVKEQAVGTLQSGPGDDSDWTTAGRRRLLSSDYTTANSPVIYRAGSGHKIPHGNVRWSIRMW